MTHTTSEQNMIEVTLEKFMNMAEDLAADWEKSAIAINEKYGKKHGGVSHPELSIAALSPEIRAYSRLNSAIDILSQYYTVVPSPSAMP